MDDERIIDLYWERSESAIQETDFKYGRFCKSVAVNILKDQEDAVECINDTYLAAWNSMPPQRPSKLKAFLGRIARNIAFDRYDYNAAKKRNREMNLILSELEDCLASPFSVEEEAQAGETAELISMFLKNLEQESRIVFIRRYWYSESILDIARRFHMSESKVKSMLFRVRNKLKDYLVKEGVVL